MAENLGLLNHVIFFQKQMKNHLKIRVTVTKISSLWKANTICFRSDWEACPYRTGWIEFVTVCRRPGETQTNYPLRSVPHSMADHRLRLVHYITPVLWVIFNQSYWTLRPSVKVSTTFPAKYQTCLCGSLFWVCDRDCHDQANGASPISAWPRYKLGWFTNQIYNGHIEWERSIRLTSFRFNWCPIGERNEHFDGPSCPNEGQNGWTKWNEPDGQWAWWGRLESVRSLESRSMTEAPWWHIPTFDWR